MPGRDPQTGQFVSGGELEAADDILVLEDGDTFSSTNNAGDDAGANTALVIGKDVEVLAVRVHTLAIPEVSSVDSNVGGTNGIGAAAQVTRRSQYTEAGSDDEIASGVLYEDTLYTVTPQTFNDTTNGSGGAGGAVIDDHEVWIDPAAVPGFNTELDAGEELWAAFEVRSIPGSEVELQLYTRAEFWVRDL